MAIATFLLVGLVLGLLAAVVTGNRRASVFGSGILLGTIGAIVGGLVGLATLRISPQHLWPGAGVLATTLIGSLALLTGWLVLRRALARKGTGGK